MQVWHDIDCQKFFMIDREGKKSPCNRYGLLPKEFIPYKSGFTSKIYTRSESPDRSFAMQPKKFDGYFQCPRPLDLTPSSSKIRLKDDINSLPKPVKFLQFSKVETRKPYPKSKTPTKLSPIKVKKGTIDITAIKQEDMPSPKSEIKTVRDLEVILENSRIGYSDYYEYYDSPERPRLKGCFTKEIPSSVELFKKEKKITILTNPLRYLREIRAIELDRKMFEKRRNQKLLRDKLDIQ